MISTILTNETLKTVGPILFVTAAGGVLGKVISSTDMINYITQNATLLEKIGIFFPFILGSYLENSTGFIYCCNYNNCRYRGTDSLLFLDLEHRFEQFLL
ncbi:MAG: hypothetical protein ACLSGB_10895 [Dorea sp.]